MASSKSQKTINDLARLHLEVVKEADSWDPLTLIAVNTQNRFGNAKKVINGKPLLR